MKKKREFLSKRAQAVIFIIVAIVIVSIVILYFILKLNDNGPGVPVKFDPIYNYYITCIEENVRNGAQLMGRQSGYIYLPEFVPGSSYMPFSNMLEFMGEGVPYWSYISGNGVVKEQVIFKKEMERQLDRYLEEMVLDCDFSSFVVDGINVTIGEASVASSIEQRMIKIEVEQKLRFEDSGEVFTSNQHEVVVPSSLGGFYDVAKKIYDHEKESDFLENYAVDLLRLYAPVDGTDVGCVPMTWSVEGIRQDIISAVENNVPAIKIKGDYYKLGKKENIYFENDIGEEVDFDINFMYDRDWPMKMDVWPNEGGILRADPIGLDEGFGMLGFCYITYHHVYDLAYPVLIYLSSGDESFQFPMVVYVNKNKPREAIDSSSGVKSVPTLCEHRTNQMKVTSYDMDLNPIAADISFECLNTKCYIGKTSSNGVISSLESLFPQCVNGYLIAESPGYESIRVLVEDINEDSMVVVMKKEYVLDINLKDGGVRDGTRAILTFQKVDGESITVSYPEMKEVKLSEGQYKIKVIVYGDSDLVIDAGSSEKCIGVPKSGISGYFGSTEEKCYNIEIPSQNIDSAVIGGGKTNYYFSESELEGSKSINIVTSYFGSPKKIEDLQINYNNAEVADLFVSLE